MCLEGVETVFAAESFVRTVGALAHFAWDWLLKYNKSLIPSNLLKGSY